MKYGVILKKTRDGFLCYVPGVKGCEARGATREEAIEKIAKVVARFMPSELAKSPMVKLDDGDEEFKLDI